MADFCRFSPKSTHLARCKRQIWCFLTCGKPRKTIHEPRFSPWGREVVSAGIRGKPGRPTNGRPIIVMSAGSPARAFVGCHLSDERRQSSHLEAQKVVFWRHSPEVLTTPLARVRGSASVPAIFAPSASSGLGFPRISANFCTFWAFTILMNLARNPDNFQTFRI